MSYSNNGTVQSGPSVPRYPTTGYLYKGYLYTVALDASSRASFPG